MYSILAAASPPPKQSPFRGAEQKKQAAVDAVQKWSTELKISLTDGKSEISTFSKDTKDAKHRPTVVAGAKAITFNLTFKVLGTILDQACWTKLQNDESHLSLQIGLVEEDL